jgi:ribosome-binding protein aMBF1 (putative translation factor)
MGRKPYKKIPPKAGTYPNNVKERALELGWNVVDLARIMNIAEATAYDICNGKRQPEFDNERKLEVLFDCKIHDMYPECYNGLDINWSLIAKGTEEEEV